MASDAPTTAKGFWRRYKWLLMRRTSQLTILTLFLIGPYFGVWVVRGTLSSSRWLDILPLTDPLIALQSFVAKFSLEQTALVGALIALAFYLVVGGRVYCSWVCPINLVTDGAHWAQERLAPQAGGRLKRNTRLWILGLVLAMSAITGTIVWEFVNPITMFHRGMLYGVGLAWVIVAGIFLLDFIGRRTWCGHLCPVGAFYGLIGKFSVLRVSAKHRERCDDCKECLAVCPERHVITAPLTGASEGVGPVILSGDCTNCGRCIDVCPQDVFGFSTRFHNAPRTEASRPALAQAAE